MTNPPTLDERVTKLEYYVFEQLPPTMAAMNLAASQTYAMTQANGEAIAGLRVDMAAMQTGVHADMFALKAAHDLQGDSLRKEIGVTRASLLTTMSAFRESVDRRFDDVHEQISGARSDVVTIKEDVDFLKHDFTFLKDEVTTVKENVTGLKQDVTGLKQDVTGLKQDVTGLKQDVTGLKEDVTGLKQGMTGLKEDVTGLKQGMTGLKEDVTGLKQGMTGVNGKLDTLIAEIRGSKN